jgi:flagellar biogenesis protein FliO
MQKVILPVVLFLALISAAVHARSEPLEGTNVANAAELSVLGVAGDTNEYLLPERRNLVWDRKHEPAHKFDPWRSLGATLMVLGALVALNLYIRKGRLGRFAIGGRRIKQIERHMIDQKRCLMLIEVDGRQILLGVTPDRIEKVVELDGVEESDADSVEEDVIAGKAGEE